MHEDREGQRGDPGWLERLLPLLLALGLWLGGASARSLWADEFHSWHHATKPDTTALLRGVRTDNHPPLSFLLEHASVRLLGVAPLSLRLPSILVGLAFLALLGPVARRLADARAARWTVGCALASSFAFVIFSEARMYALLALASLGLLHVLAGRLSSAPGPRGRPSRWWLCLWVVVGWHAHYYFVHELVVAISVTGLAALRFPGLLGRARALAAPLLLGLVLCLPWGLYGFQEQLGSELPPGHAAGASSLGVLAASIGHLFHWNASLAGPGFVRLVAWPGTVLVGVALSLGLARALRSARRRDDEGLRAWLVLAFGLGLPLWAWSVSLVYPRASYGWRYIAGAAAPVFLLAVVGTAGADPLRRTLRVLVAATMLAVTGVNLWSGGHEDHAKLVALVLAEAQPGDALVAKPPYDPEPDPRETSWRFYAHRVERPPDAVEPVAYGYDQLAQARTHPRVWVWFRDRYHQWVRRDLAKSFQNEESWVISPSLVLYRYSNPLRNR